MKLLIEDGILFSNLSNKAYNDGFGILDSGRSDVVYDDWHGHKTDRKLLDLYSKKNKPAG